ARIVHRVLGVIGPAVAGEPDPGIAVQLQQLPTDRQRAIFHDLMRWPGAYYLTPASGRGGQSVIVIRWRHHHPDVKVTFLADAVADRDDSGIWTIEQGLLP
ncbi:MAG: hypothetical protein IE926_20330, partial [Micrococcales bacterium]|nr:hypothetical protein [Micrococcales bacterium]